MEIPLIGSWWAVALLFLGCLLYLYLTWNHDYWKKRGIPYVRPLPIFGNFMDAFLQRKNIGQVFEELYWKLDGHKYGGMFRMSQPVLVVRDPEIVKTVLVKDFSSFHDNDIDVDVDMDPVFGKNPFVLKGESWKMVRGIVTTALTVGKIKPYFSLMAEVCKELTEAIQKSGTIQFEAKEICARFTTDIVATCGYGIKGNALQNPSCEFRQMGREIIEPGLWKNIKFFIIFFFPRIAKLFDLRFGTDKVNAFFLRIITEVLTHREKNNIVRPDFLQHLIDLKKKGFQDDNETEKDKVANGIDSKPTAISKYLSTIQDICAQASTFFVDGYETSSGVLAFSLYCLAIYPDVQAQLRREVDSNIKKHNGELTFDGIQEMKYLEMVLSEVLRVYPPGTVLTKKCTKAFNLEKPSGGVYLVETGTPIAIPLYAIHHDPKYFADPERFDPERFSEENKINIQKYTYFPFGDGPRICLGRRFAATQVKAGIATVLHNFELRPNKKTKIPIVQDPHYFILASKGGLWIDIVNRSDK